MYRFFAFDQSGLTTAVWQYIFHFLLRIGNKDDVIDDIKKHIKQDGVTCCVFVSVTTIVSITLIA